jgi:hypothetical protein
LAAAQLFDLRAEQPLHRGHALLHLGAELLLLIDHLLARASGEQPDLRKGFLGLLGQFAELPGHSLLDRRAHSQELLDNVLHVTHFGRIGDRSFLHRGIRRANLGIREAFGLRRQDDHLIEALHALRPELGSERGNTRVIDRLGGLLQPAEQPHARVKPNHLLGFPIRPAIHALSRECSQVKAQVQRSATVQVHLPASMRIGRLSHSLPGKPLREDSIALFLRNHHVHSQCTMRK